MKLASRRPSDINYRRQRERRLLLEQLENRALLATFHVALTGSDGNTGGAADPYRTVQAAINAAAVTADGADFVRVEAGTYDTAGVDLGLSIPSSANLQDLQLQGGYDVGSTFATRTPRSTIYVPQTIGSVNLQDVNVADANATIDGFHFVFDGNGVGGTGGTRLSGGVLSNTTGFHFNDNAVEVGLGRVAAGARSLGVATTATDQTGLQITNNTITADGGTGAAFNDFGHGIFLNPDPIRTADAIISGNTITGTTLANGILVDTSGHLTITGNTIVRTGTGNVFNLALIGLRARSVITTLDDVTISQNTLDSAGRANSIAIHFADAGGTQPIAGVLVDKNLIQNNTTGIVIGPGANQNNAISATINFNSFTGNTTAMFRSTLLAGSTTIDATRNWWNDITGPTTAANPGGAGQSINDTTGIDFQPWLVYSPDSNPALPGVQLPATVSVAAGNDVSAAENDFTLLQNAVGSVAEGQTLDLSGDFDWTATNAAAAYAASTNTSATADIRGVELPGGVNNVTITSSATDAHILGGGDTDDSFNAFLFAEDGPSVGNANFILEKLDIDDFENAVMFGWNGTGTFTGTKIRDNSITVGGDDGGLADLQNIAIYFAAGTNQQITGNTVSFQGDGTRAVGSGARSFGFQNNTTGGALYDNLVIDDNTFQLLPTSTGVEIIHGIWENSHNDDNTADIAITNNDFLGRTGVDDFDRALFLTSQTDGLVIDGNAFTDVDNVLFSRNAAGGVEAGDEFTFTNNVLTRVGGADGIFLRNVTDDAVPITVVVHWNINNTIDGETGVRGLNELSTQATHASRPLTAASDLNAVIAEGSKDPVFVDVDWVGSGRFTDPDGIGTGAGPVAFQFNGFASIQAGIDAVDDGGTVNVGAGTYAENVLVNKNVDLLGPNAGINPNTAVRGAEAIVVPAAVQTSVQGSTSGTVFRVGTGAGHIDATISGFQIDGHNAALVGGRTLNGVEVHTGAGIVTSTGSFDDETSGFNVTLTAQNNIIQNLERYGVYISGVNSGTTVLAGSDVSFNKIDNLPSGNNFGGDRGRAAAFGWDVYGSFTNNVVTRVNVGWQDDNHYQASTGAGTVVNDNDIRAYHRGIFHNLQYGTATAATISDNEIAVETNGDFSASTTNFGIELSSIASAVSATVSNNNVTGTVHGILLWNLPTTGVITVSGGTLTDNSFGILATNNDPQFGAVSTPTSAVISSVTVVDAANAGIRVHDDPTAGATGAVSLTVQDGSDVSGSFFGIHVLGTAASATVQDNLIHGNGIGIDVDGGTAAITGNTITGTSAATGIRVVNAGGITSLTNNAISTQSGDAIRIQASAGSISPIFNNSLLAAGGAAVRNLTATLLDASGNWWGTNTPNGVGAEAGANVDYTPWLDDGEDTSADPGFQGEFFSLHVDDNSPQVGAMGRISEGFDDLTAFGTLTIHSGSYTEDVDATPKASTLVLGNGAASVSITGNLILDSNEVLDLELGNTPGVTGDLLEVSGTLTFGSAIAQLSALEPLNAGNTLIVIKRGANSDFFGNLAQLEQIDVDGNFLTTQYFLADGNDFGFATQQNPSIGNAGSTLNYTEDDPPTLIVPTANVSDLDNAVLNGGYLQVLISQNAEATDVLAIRSIGSGPGEIQVVGDEVQYEGNTFGFISGGAGSPLQIDFDSSGNATLAAVQALVRSITFESTSDAPATTKKALFFLDDGTGGTGAINKNIAITLVNDAPVLDTSLNPTLTTISEDATNPAGTQVSTLLAGALSDPDGPGLQGIAVSAASSFHGEWEYSLDAGATWSSMGTPTATAALLLPDSAFVRFIPDANFNGTVRLWYHAWDQTEGTAGGTLPSVGQPNTSSVGIAWEGAALTVLPVNDAPVLDTSLNPTLRSTSEDAQVPASTLVADLLTGAISDVDEGALKGIAVSAASSFYGDWEYSLDGGATWTSMGTPSASAALLLPDSARVRFDSRADFNGTVKLWYHAWDQTQGVAGGTLPARGNTNTASVGNEWEGASLTVLPVNDAPVLTLSGTVGYARDTAPIQLAPNATVRDIDSDDFGTGRLRVHITDGADGSNRLAIGAGFTVDADDNVLQGSTIIGKRTFNGFGTNDLVVRFNANATPFRVQQLVRAITFKTVGGSAGDRKVVFDVKDGDGGLSNEAFKTVNVT